MKFGDFSYLVRRVDGEKANERLIAHDENGKEYIVEHLLYDPELHTVEIRILT